jgi:hypothetical protein
MPRFEKTAHHFPLVLIDCLIEFHLPLVIDQPLVSGPWSFRLQDFPALHCRQTLSSLIASS